ncbi:unnamed protein product [Danaus chrysippus]|uniref:(African queen) hypothetical protein n=1 Tax=Danaus chrysippus TaxID=151541 RepID=A0A8J2W7S6_9NEOP|nr:unnamed protein product [Danaus chrysippus]
MSRRLQDRDIEELLNALESGNLSDDGMEDENEDEELFYETAREILQDLDRNEEVDNEETATSQDNSDPPLVEDEISRISPCPTGYTLCNIGSTNGNKRGRPSNDSLEREIQAKKQKKSAHPLPSKVVRKDGIDHWPQFSD